ncbi:MAG: tyrosine-type recombinase/integrase [Xanthobacteraceae bacterium]
MKTEQIQTSGAPATLQDVLDRLSDDGIVDSRRRRDLRSAVASFAKLVDKAPGLIPLDLAAIRHALDSAVPAQAGVSAKRWANLRSDLSAAIEASGLCPILKTAKFDLAEPRKQVLDAVQDQRIRHGLSRLARWASLRGIAPSEVDDLTIERFISELRAYTLIRNIDDQQRRVTMAWNWLAKLQPNLELGPVSTPSKAALRRFDWQQLPASFQNDVECHLTWTSVPDPLDENARRRPLAPKTRHLRREYIHSAVSAAVAGGIDPAQLTSLATLVAPDTFKAALVHRLKQDGSKLTAYTHGVAGTLIAIAQEWVNVPAETLAGLKAMRRKLGNLPTGLTSKNKALLRKFDNPLLLEKLIALPDKLWRKARRELAESRRPFIDLQNALAIDLLIHVPLRMENLSALMFGVHLHWPQGPGRAAQVVFAGDETKNQVQLEFEIPAALADHLHTYRNEIAPVVTGKRPDAVFVTWTGKPRGQAAITDAIEKAILKNLGVRLTPHQFRHLVAKIILDANPGAYELVRQMLGHKNTKTTTNFYAGIDTRRAGRAHADLIMQLRKNGISRRGRSRRRSPAE